MDPFDKQSIASLFAKDAVNILVTDSGLGGLSIFAHIVARLKKEPILRQVSLTYFNAWPEQHRGYNALKDTEERVRVFDAALEGMKRYRPDIILIACNTLSVLYERTAFSRREHIPVVDIVHFGVDMVHEHLTRNKEAVALLLGTVTTISADVHRSALLEKGISPHRLFTQPCDQLATRIEKGPDSDEVKKLIDTFMSQAAAKMSPAPMEVFAALICTHFGYSRNLIKQHLENKLHKPVTIIDPNLRMAAFLFEVSGGRRHKRTKVNLRVVSRIVWEQTKIDAVAKVIEIPSPETATALKKYEWIPELFTF